MDETTLEQIKEAGGNPRRLFGEPTAQEQRNAAAAQEAFEWWAEHEAPAGTSFVTQRVRI